MDEQGSLFQTAQGGGAIWSHDNSLFHVNSEIDDLLDMRGVKLEQILNEEDILQEVKAVNTKLIEFLTREDILMQLIDYFTLPPQVDDSMDEEQQLRKIHKFPYIACEVICCNSYDIVTRFLTDDGVFYRLFQILDSSEAIDPRLAGFFHKVVFVLMKRNPDYVLMKCSTTKIVQKDSDQPVEVDSWLVDKLLNHMDNYSIVDTCKLFLQVATGQIDNFVEEGETIQGNEIVTAWQNDLKETADALQRIKRMWSGGEGSASKILNIMQESGNSDIHSNASELLADMLQRLAYDEANGDSDETNVEEWSTDLASKLVEVAFKIEPNTPFDQEVASDAFHGQYNTASESVAGLKVLVQLVGAYAKYSWQDSACSIPKQFQPIVNHLSQLPLFLQNGSMGQANQGDSLIKTQWGGTITRLGMRRLQIIQLVCFLIHSKYEDLLKAIAETDILLVCIDLFFTFEWNNVLHSVVETIIRFILTGGVSEMEQRRELEQHQLESNARDMMSAFDHNSLQRQFESPAGVETRRLEQCAAQKLLAPLQECLFGRVKIIDRLLDAYDKNGENFENSNGKDKASPKHGQKGYMGFCHVICNNIQDLVALEKHAMQDESNLLPHRNQFALNACKSERWQKFVDTELKEINMVESCLLGGENRPSKSEVGSDALDALRDAMPTVDLDIPTTEEPETVVLDFGLGQNDSEEQDLNTWNPFQKENDGDQFFVVEGDDDGVSFEADFSNLSISEEAATAAVSDVQAETGSAWVANFEDTFDPFADEGQPTKDETSQMRTSPEPKGWVADFGEDG